MKKMLFVTFLSAAAFAVGCGKEQTTSQQIDKVHNNIEYRTLSGRPDLSASEVIGRRYQVNPQKVSVGDLPLIYSNVLMAILRCASTKRSCF